MGQSLKKSRDIGRLDVWRVSVTDAVAMLVSARQFGPTTIIMVPRTRSKPSQSAGCSRSRASPSRSRFTEYVGVAVATTNFRGTACSPARSNLSRDPELNYQVFAGRGNANVVAGMAEWGKKPVCCLYIKAGDGSLLPRCSQQVSGVMVGAIVPRAGLAHDAGAPAALSTAASRVKTQPVNPGGGKGHNLPVPPH